MRRLSLKNIKKVQAINLPTTQIALGIGDIDASDDLWKIAGHCRENGVIPNVTINGYRFTDEIADRLSNVMGAVAVSRYEPKDACYDAIKKLTDRGMEQVNIHMVLSKDRYSQCMEAIDDIKADPRLEKLNAIVFLMLKPKGRASIGGDSVPSLKQYQDLVSYALDKNVRIGFDSCSAPSFIYTIKDHENAEMFEMLTDHCESGLFSFYIDVDGDAYPCSFTPGTKNWEEGISVLEVDNFIDGVWNHPKVMAWKKNLLNSSAGCVGCPKQNGCRKCPVFDISVCEIDRRDNEG